MKFGCIISECGLNPKNYPHSSEIVIEAFDCKNHKISKIKFKNSIFDKNPNSKKEFENFLNTFEKNKFFSKAGTIKILENAIILHFPNNPPRLFLR